MPRSISYLIRAVSVCVLVAGATAHAMTVSKLSDDAFAPLREANVRQRITLHVPLRDQHLSSIELEEFDVWSPGGKVIVHSAKGVTKLDPPNRRYFRGPVDGELESFAFFSVDPETEAVEGMIVVKDQKYTIGGRRKTDARPSPTRFDDYLMANGLEDEVPNEMATWSCMVDEARPSRGGTEALHALGPDGFPVKAAGISGTQRYAITVEIQTDFEYYQDFGSNIEAATQWLTSLTGAVSTIYNRDLKTNVFIGNLVLWTTASDPWSATDAVSGLAELTSYYQSTATRTTSSVILMSGKDVGEGFANTNIICGPDSPGYGPYAWCGEIGRQGALFTPGTIPDVNTPPYNMPPFICPGGPCSNQAFWPLEEYAHELGHNLAGKHTHCLTLTPADQATYGRTFIDGCTNAEGAFGCFNGSPAAPAEKGTIMSYCHNIIVSFVPQSRYIFGKSGEASHEEIDNQMLLASGPPDGGTNIVNGVSTFTIGAITAPGSVTANSSGNVASIPSIVGATYQWSIVNGTIQGSRTGNSVTFTAGPSGAVVLTAAAFNSTKCGVSDSVAVPIGSCSGAAGSPPGSVKATYNQLTGRIDVSWTPLCGFAGQYEVFRSNKNDYTIFSGSAVGTVLATSGSVFSDAVPAGVNAYLYKVRSANVGGGSPSTFSAVDVGTSKMYTNTTLSSMSSIFAVDLNETQAAINAVRTLAKVGTFAFTAATAGVTPVSAAGVNTLRQKLQDAFTPMGLGTLTFSQPTLTPGTTLIDAIDFNELRNAMK